MNARWKFPAVMAAMLPLLMTHARSHASADEPALPVWDPRSNAPGSTGGSLVPFLPPPSEAPAGMPSPEKPPTRLFMEDGALQSDDLNLFLQGGPEQARRPAPDPVSSPLRELSPARIAGLRSLPRDTWLMDPLALLPAPQSQSLHRLLQYHAANATSRLHLLVIEQDQFLPDQANPGLFAGGALSGNNVALIVCPLGETWRSRFYLGSSLREGVPAHLAAEMIRDCVRDSQLVLEPEQQVQRLAVRASTWLFRLENFLKPAPAQSLRNPLREIAPAINSSAEAPGNLSVLWLPAFGLAFLLSLMLWRHSRRATFPDERIWLLEEPEIVPRLGGAFCGGGGAVLHHGKTGGPRSKA
ncbi:MAG TPA: hypothetical protein DIT13_12525 [Verrucomicrobiales bacterium]|nr:hypothetical protein [Verrucomicrobiales bacterium]